MNARAIQSGITDPKANAYRIDTRNRGVYSVLAYSRRHAVAILTADFARKDARFNPKETTAWIFVGK